VKLKNERLKPQENEENDGNPNWTDEQLAKLSSIGKQSVETTSNSVSPANLKQTRTNGELNGTSR